MSKSLTNNKYTKEQRLAQVDMNSLDDVQFKNLMYDIDRLQTLDKTKTDTCEFGTYCIDKSAINGLYKKYGIDFQYEDDDSPNADNRFTADSVLKDIERFSGYNTYEYSKQQAVEAMLHGAKEASETQSNPQYEAMRRLFDGESNWHTETGNTYKAKSLDDYFEGYKQEQGNKSSAVKGAGIMDTIYKSRERNAQMLEICSEMNKYFDSPWLTIATSYFKIMEMSADKRVQNLRQELLTKMEVKDLRTIDAHKAPELSIDKKFDNHVAINQDDKNMQFGTIDKRTGLPMIKENSIYHAPADENGNRSKVYEASVSAEDAKRLPSETLKVKLNDVDYEPIFKQKDLGYTLQTRDPDFYSPSVHNPTPFSYSETIRKFRELNPDGPQPDGIKIDGGSHLYGADGKAKRASDFNKPEDLMNKGGSYVDYGNVKEYREVFNAKAKAEDVNKFSDIKDAVKKVVQPDVNKVKSLTPERETHKDEPKAEPKKAESKKAESKAETKVNKKTEPKAENKAEPKPEKNELKQVSPEKKSVFDKFKKAPKPADPKSFDKATADLDNFNKKSMDAIKKAMNEGENVMAKESANPEYTPAG